MFSREQASRIREEFWTTFGHYMRPVLSADGVKINWVNYKTGFKDVFFKMQTRRKSAVIGVFLTHDDPEIQELYFEQFLQNKSFMESIISEVWEWDLNVYDDNGKIISSIYCEKENISVMNRDNWPELISFFKPRIIALDEFWSMASVSFEALR